MLLFVFLFDNHWDEERLGTRELFNYLFIYCIMNFSILNPIMCFWQLILTVTEVTTKNNLKPRGLFVAFKRPVLIVSFCTNASAANRGRKGTVYFTFTACLLLLSFLHMEQILRPDTAFFFPWNLSWRTLEAPREKQVFIYHLESCFWGCSDPPPNPSFLPMQRGNTAEICWLKIVLSVLRFSSSCLEMV